MTETEIVKRIQELKQIKPRKDWVSLNKRELLGKEPGFVFSPYFNPAMAGLIAVFIFFGVFGFAQNSLPGDFLYPVKKIAEKGQAVFVSSEEKPVFQMKLANEKLEDLAKTPARNLAQTINEFQANVSEAARNLDGIDATTSTQAAVKKIVREAKKLDENRQKVESLGMVVEGRETENFNKAVVEYLIEFLGSRTLTEEDELVLEQMKELFENERYSEALELYLIGQ